MAGDDDTFAAPGALAQRSVGPYLLQSVLGTGGMGVVYRATAPDGRPVAVKTMRAFLGGPEMLRRFEREAGIRVQHPNVVDVLGAGTDADGTAYIVFELLEGESFESILARGPLPAPEVLEMGIAACAGLQAAHEQGIIHRDLKPANLFRCQDGRIKILDFGVALLAFDESHLTRTGHVVGTPLYLAPEQARGRRAEIDPRTDVWALGAVLYHAITGRPPFDAETALAAGVAIITDALVPLGVLAPWTPPALAEVVERALSKPREERWGSAAAMAAALVAVDPRTGVATAQPAPILPAGETRLVALLLAEGVRDAELLERVVVGGGGAFLALMGQQALGVFGGHTWEGDELARAVEVGLRARAAAEAISVARGRAFLSGGGLTGGALRAAEVGCAARLGGVAVDAEAARSLGATFTVRSVSAGLCEVTGRTSRGTSAPASTEEHHARTVGRDAEIAQLRSSLRTALDGGQAVAVMVTGPAGIGKSRLCQELERLVQAAETPVVLLTGRAEPHSREQLSLFRSVLEGRAQVGARAGRWQPLDEADPLSRQRVVASLAREAIDDDLAAERCASHLGALLGVPASTSRPLADRDARLAADRIRLALLDYLDGLARRSPVALLLEDLQWADDLSLAMIGDLLDHLGGSPLLLLATARSELVESGRDPLAGRGSTRIVLRPLGAAEAARMAEEIAGRALPDSVHRAIAERAGGNPLFVEQLVVALAERPGDGDPRDIPLPLTVEAAVQSRLDHLPPAEKELCKRASVFGRPFSTAEAEALDVPGLGELLRSVGRRDIIVARSRSSGGAREHQFRSRLVAEVAYRMLSDEVRQTLHRRVALLLDAGASPDPEEVASHHERGGQPERAVPHWVEATLRAAARGDGPSVLRCSSRALELGAPAESRYALQMARCDALRFLGPRDAREAEAALSAASTDAERARAWIEKAGLSSRIGNYAEATSSADEAIAAARRAADDEALALALGMSAQALIRTSRLPAATEALAEARGLTSAAGPHLRAMVEWWSAELAGAVGDLGARRDRFRAAAHLFREAGDVRRAASMLANLADVYNRVGAYAEAEAELRSAIEGCRRVGNQVGEGYALVNLGYSLTRLGKSDAALAAITEAAGIARSSGSVHLAVVARLYELRARFTTMPAREVALASEELAGTAESRGLSGLGVLALALSARARLVAGDRAEADAHSARALEILGAIGGIEEDETEVFLIRAKVLLASGRKEEAVEVLANARRRIEDVSARIADPELRARFRTDVPGHGELWKLVSVRTGA